MLKIMMMAKMMMMMRMLLNVYRMMKTYLKSRKLSVKMQQTSKMNLKISNLIKN